MKHLVIVLFALLLSFPALAGEKRGCDERCQFQKHAPGTNLKPAVPNMVCFQFVQNQPGFVTFTLYRVYFGLNDPRNRVLRQIKHTTPDGTHGEFCVGPQWVRASVWADLCDTFSAHSDRGIPSLKKGLETGIVEMCLLGDDRCPRFVY